MGLSSHSYAWSECEAVGCYATAMRDKVAVTRTHRLRTEADDTLEGGRDCVIAANEYGRYCMPRASIHRPVPQAILRGLVWERETLGLLCSVDSGSDIVHAGAFFGDFLPALSGSRTGRAVVWAFEPNRENHHSATVTMRLNGLQKVKLASRGLGNKSGRATLVIREEDGTPLGGGSRLAASAPAGRAWSEGEEIAMTTIDQAVPGDRDVAAIQLDVEGNERAALEGAMSTVRRCRPLLVLETVPEPTWIDANLTPLGYAWDGNVNGNTVFRPA